MPQNSGGIRRRRALRARAWVAFKEGFMESGALINGELYEHAQEVLDPRDKVSREPGAKDWAQRWIDNADAVLEEAFEDWWKDRPEQ